nr:hypothetical protein Iba_scaffold2333CG0060 [Ipomoea batatas]
MSSSISGPKASQKFLGLSGQGCIFHLVMLMLLFWGQTSEVLKLGYMLCPKPSHKKE